jgi:uncharacterized Zn finger protein (UPF0148 family)
VATTEVKKKRKRVELTKLLTYKIADRQSEEVDAKECRKCCIVIYLAEYHRKSGGLGGKKSICPTCESSYGSIYRTENRSAINERNAIYRTNNAEKKLASSKRYREKNRDKTKAYWQSIRERAATLKKDYRARNLSTLRESNKRYYLENKDRIKKRVKVYASENPEVPRISGQKRLARKKSLPFVIKSEQFAIEFLKFNNACALTTANDSVHIEHFISLSTGHGGTYVGNIYPLNASLNCSKRSSNPFEWICTRPDIDANRFDAVVAHLADLNGLTLDEYRHLVDWCYANPRTIDEIKRDNDRYGYVVSSLELWRESTGIAFPIRIDFRNIDAKEVSAS